MKKISTNDQEPESECLTINLSDYRKLRRVKAHLVELNNIRNALISSAQTIAEFCEKNNDVNKIYNEICTSVEDYTRLIDTYNHHLKRLERNNGI
jgi:Mg2+ and Co2+ transporter CorA